MAENKDIFAMSDAALVAAIAQQKDRAEAAYLRAKARSATFTLLSEAAWRAMRCAAVALLNPATAAPIAAQRRAALETTLQEGTRAVDALVELADGLERMSAADILAAEAKAKADYHTNQGQQAAARLVAAGERYRAQRGIPSAGSVT